jgi:hypothetical protein
MALLNATWFTDAVTTSSNVFAAILAARSIR